MKILFYLFFVLLIIGCTDTKQNYLSEGEKILKAANGDKTKVEKAIKLFNKELQINPNSIKAIHNLASAYSSVSKNDSGKIILSKAIENNKKELAELYQGRGMINFILKKYDESIEDFNEAIKFNGGNVQLYNQMIFSKMWKNNYKDGEWHLTEEDILKLIDEVYPDTLDKPSVEEFRSPNKSK